MDRPKFSSIVAGLIVAAGLYAAVPTPTANAQVFNPHFIISDADMRDSRSMTYEEIVAFLKSKGGLADVYDIDPADGLLKSVPQLIADASARNNVSPKFMIALLQKESGIVEADKPTQGRLDWAAGYAVCDSCSLNAPQVKKYKGVAKQIDGMASWIKWYFEKNGALAVLPQPGIVRNINGTRVVPVNLATAALYSYTPHLHGNRVLSIIWNRWFASNEDRKLYFPEGTLLSDEDTGAYAVVQNEKIRPILSLSVLLTRFNATTAIALDHTTFDYLHGLNPGDPLRFPENALLQLEDGAIYLLANRQRRKVESPEAFRSIGFNPEEIETATLADLADYPEGPAITGKETYVPPQLLQDARTGGVYLVVDGVKQPLLDKALLAANFKGMKTIKGTAKALDALPTGSPVKLNDGTLVKLADSSKVFVIAGGLRRAIPDEATFTGYGYNFKNVLNVGQKLLDLHPLGEPLRLPQLDEEVPPTTVAKK